MKLLLVTSLLFLQQLTAQTLSLQDYISDSKTSSYAKLNNSQSNITKLQDQFVIQADGFKINTNVAYAELKSLDERALEGHLSIEKEFLLSSSENYMSALENRLQKQQLISTNRLEAKINSYYIQACSFKERAQLMYDQKERSNEFTKLMREGYEGGEFDYSVLLQSELITESLLLQEEDALSQFYTFKKELQSYSSLNSSEPLCEDLSSDVKIQETFLESSLIYKNLEVELAKMEALHKIQKRTFQRVNVGLGYEDEMDVSRVLLFAQIPLGASDNLETQREITRLSIMQKHEEKLLLKQTLESTMQSYINQQERYQKQFNRLNDKIIPKSYETLVLLREKFLGGEGDYLSFLNAQKALYAFLIQSSNILVKSHLANAKLDYLLAQSPLKEKK